MSILPSFIYIHQVCAVPKEVRRGIKSPETGVAGSCGLPNVDSENWTWVLWKNSENF